MNSYQQQAVDFLNQTNTTMTITPIGMKVPPNWGTQPVNTYSVVLKNTDGRYKFEFFTSINDTKTNTKPNEYDILACLNIDYSEDFSDFCNLFGYDEYEDKSAKKIYKAVQKETQALLKMFNEEQIELLEEIR